MITSEAQVKRAASQIDGLEAAISAVAGHPDLSDVARNGIVQSHRAMVNQLKSEIEQFQLLRTGVVRLPAFFRLTELGGALPAFRIALGMSQEQLAEQVSVTRKTLGGYEADGYQRADLHFVQRVVDELGCRISIQINHPNLVVEQSTFGPERPTAPMTFEIPSRQLQA